jgi:hypothetical protein
MTRSELLERKALEYAGLVKDAFRRYQVPGKFSEEDLEQDLLICVNSLIEDHPNLDPFSEDFTNIVKTAFYRDVISTVRRYLTQGRNYHLEVELYSETEDGAVIEHKDLSTAVQDSDFYWLNKSDPVEAFEYKEVKDRIRNRLPSDTKVLFDLLEDQESLSSRLTEYNQSVKATLETPRRRTVCRDIRNSHFIGYCLGWTSKKVKQHFGILQEKMSVIMGDE